MLPIIIIMSTKYNPTFNKPPFIPPKSSFTPTKEAPREVDPANITQIFDAATQGDISTFRNIIFNTNTPLNVKQGGETLIHRVILNPNISNENDKLEIIKYLVEHEAGYSHNNFNVYPLHLACKFQYKHIVEYLLNVVDVNASDNNGMNALHYLVQGQIGMCPENKKISKLVDVKKSGGITTKDLKDLSIGIIDVLNGKLPKLYFVHIKNIFTKLNENYPEIYDTTDLDNKINNTINIFGKDNKLKKKEIQKHINDYVNNIKKTLADSKFNDGNIDTKMFEENMGNKDFINNLLIPHNDHVNILIRIKNAAQAIITFCDQYIREITENTNKYFAIVVKTPISKQQEISPKVLRKIDNFEFPMLNVIGEDVHMDKNKKYFFGEEISYYLNIIKNLSQYIENICTDENTNNDNLEIYEKQFLCTLTNIFNTMQYCLKIRQINDKIKIYNDTQKLDVKTKVLYLQTDKNAFVVDDNKIYDNCIAMIKDINEAINIINISTFNEAIRKMAIGIGNIPTFKNCFNMQLQNININNIRSLDNYFKIMNDKTLEDQRKYIYENYFPVISEKYALTYISDKNANNGRKGFIINQTTDNQNNDVNTPTNIQYPDTNILAFTKTYDNNVITFDGLITDTTLVEDYFIGHIATLYNPSNQYKKLENLDVTLLGNKLNEYVKIIKLYVIQYIIPKINASKKQDFENKIKKLNPNITNENLNKTYISYVTKIANIIINIFIKNAIYESINVYMDRLKTLGPLKTFNSIENIDIKHIDTNFRFDLDDIDDDINVVDQTLYPINMLDPISNPKKFQLNDITYNMPTSYTKEQCYKINVDIIDLLYKKSINMNKKDSTGSTPLTYALESNNSDVIKQLLSYPIVSVIDNTIKNQIGNTPYKHFTNLYKIYLPNNNNNNINNILKTLIDPTLANIKNNIATKFGNNVLKSLDTTFYQLIIMYNNMMYFYSKSYMNGWNYNDNDALSNILFGFNSINGKKYKLPLLDNFKQQIMDKSINYNNIVESKNKITKKVDNYDKKTDFLNNILESLTKELETYTNLNTNGDYTNIINQINIKINSVNEKMISNFNKQTNLNNPTINTAQKYQDYQNISREFNNIKNANDPEKYMAYELVSNQYKIAFQDLADIYKNIYDQGVCKTQKCSDYILYNELWNDVINDETKLNNITNIHLLITNHITKLLGQMNNVNYTNPKNAKPIYDEFVIIKKFYDSILIPTINRADELPQYYNMQENYILTETLDIITHITKHTLCSNFYYTIMKLLSVNVSDTNALKNSKLNTDLMTHILDKMPKLLVKNTLKIYKDDHEMDSINDNIIYNKIVEIITSNTEYTIPNDSNIITNLKGKIFEYYKYVFELVIKQMDTTIKNYNKLISIDCNFISCSVLLNERVVKL